MQELITIILAAGEGKRMNSSAAKLTHKLCGQPLLTYVTDASRKAGFNSFILILGHQADEVRKLAPEGSICVIQHEQLGTGHAVLQAKEILEQKNGTALILCGDTPLITSDTLKKAYDYHLKNCNHATVITAYLDDPYGYGRIIKDKHRQIIDIIEEKDCTPEQRLIKEINSGMYFFNIGFLLQALSRIDNLNEQGEYYLTDTIRKIVADNGKVGTFTISDSSEILGVNDRVQLSEAEAIIQKRIIREHMKNGVTFHLPETCMIHKGVRIGRDTVIHPGTMLEGNTIIGEGCEIGPNSRITNSVIGNGVNFMYSVMIDSQVGNHTNVGPFAYIRPSTHIGNNIKIGDFVEIKNSNIGDNTKIPHLSYIGDADLGKGINIGCGTIVVNYDGKKKHRTTIGDCAFVGCNVNLVSPVTINKNSFIAAGSTITEEVPPYALAIARSRQTIKENWVKKKNLTSEHHVDTECKK